MGLLVPAPEDFETAVEAILDKAASRQENQEAKAFDDEDREAAKAKGGKASAFAKKKRPEHAALPLFQVLHKLVPWADPGLCASCIAAALKAGGRTVLEPFKVNIDDVPYDEVVSSVHKAA